MPTIGYADLPIPGGGDGPDGAAAIAALAAALDPHLVQHVANLADRTARLSAAPVRTLAIAANGTAWTKTSATTDTWVTLWEPTPAWRTLGLAAGFEQVTSTPQIRLIGKQVFVRGRVQKVSGGLIGTANTEVLAVMPSDCWPTRLCFWAGGSSITGDPMTALCRIEIAGPAQALPTGSLSMYSQDGGQDGGTVGTSWVDISGSYWID
ncbi:hypothetical protein [Streptomyces hirsutus]|uniref:hypothetical protein n=1 Tax=Streptomyces hirsutus TaxID=35620 RepID=UPI00365050ED